MPRNRAARAPLHDAATAFPPRRAPALHETEWRKQWGFSPLARRFALLNVSFVDQRADGHVGGAMAYHSDPAKKNGGRDCLHYCLPGPSDAWALALYNLLLNNRRYARQGEEG